MPTVTQRDLSEPETVVISTGDVGNLPAVTGDGEKFLMELFSKKEVSALAKPTNTKAVPYVGNAHPMSQKWSAMSLAGLKQADYYINIDDQYTKLDPFRYWLVDAQSFMSKIDESGTVLAITQNMDLKQKLGFDLQEHYVGLFIVDINGMLVPARASFRYLKAKTIKSAADAIKMATHPAWATASDANRVASASSAPFGRIYTEAVMASKVAKSGQRAGKPYDYTIASPRPTTEAQLKLLSTNLADPEFKKKLVTAAQSYLDECTKLISQCEATKEHG